ncbi:hypothetical protein NVP1262O_39 [Vibrio phage 1.262.O._10N.286.51.A9]|nr:hypothetical protein NVP1262O_39 [Vibrio phage 1.262.O._10N.286.51.A9]
MNKNIGQKILEECITVKKQKAVSLPILAEILGVPVMTEDDIAKLIESRKFPQFKE